MIVSARYLGEARCLTCTIKSKVSSFCGWNAGSALCYFHTIRVSCLDYVWLTGARSLHTDFLLSWRTLRVLCAFLTYNKYPVIIIPWQNCLHSSLLPNCRIPVEFIQSFCCSVPCCASCHGQIHARENTDSSGTRALWVCPVQQARDCLWEQVIAPVIYFYF